MSAECDGPRRLFVSPPHVEDLRAAQRPSHSNCEYSRGIAGVTEVRKEDLLFLSRRMNSAMTSVGGQYRYGPLYLTSELHGSNLAGPEVSPNEA